MSSGGPVEPGLFVLDVIAANGVPFRVVAIPPGMPGPNPFRVVAEGRDHTVVEVYDRRYPRDEPHPGFCSHGQFTGGWYDLDTVLAVSGGISLAGDIDEWEIDAWTVVQVREWLGLLRNRGAFDR